MKKESFWESEQIEIESNTEEHTNDLFFIPYSLNDLEMEIEEAKDYLDNIELIRAQQFRRLINLQEKYIVHMDTKQYQDYERIVKKKGRTLIELDQPIPKILRITLNYLLPYYPKSLKNKLSYYTALIDVYQQDLADKLYSSRYEIPNFKESNKVFVLILQYVKSNKIIDLDNRIHSFIFNALRSAQITLDDKWQKLAYMEEGRAGEEEKTEIYICDYGRIHEVLHFLNEISGNKR
jgi:hypothetical protein